MECHTNSRHDMLRLASNIAVLAICSQLTSWYIGAAIFCVLYLGTGGWAWLNILAKTFKRDVYFLQHALRTLVRILIFMKRKKSTKDFIYKNARLYPDKLAFVDADSKEFLTFKDVEELSLRIAHVFHDAGFRKGGYKTG